MDTLDKLEISLSSKPNIKTIIIDKSLAGEVLFEFNEHEKVSIKYKGTKYEVFLECYSYKYKNKIYMVDDGVTLENNSNYIISDINHEELRQTPELYKIIFRINKTNIEAYYQITTNKDVSNLGLTKIKEELENLKPGIIYDRMKKGKKTVSIDNHNSIISLVDNWNTVKWNLLSHKQDLRFETKYVYSLKPGKSNFKSLIKEEKRPSDRYLNVVKIANAGSKTDSLYLIKIREKINEYNHHLLSDYNSNKEILNKKEKAISSLLPNETASVNKARQNEYYSLTKEIDRLSKHLDNYKKRFGIIKDIELFLAHHNDYDEAVLARIYTNLVKKSVVRLSNKPSSKLFELYGFVIVYKILTSLGFEAVNIEEFKRLSVINSSTKLSFTYNNYKVELYYEYLLKHYSDGENDSLVSVITNHNKPDFIVMFYKDDKFINSLIIEMKYRNSYYLLNSKYNNTVENTDNYALSCYKDKKGNVCRNAVSEVILINPDANQDEDKMGVGTTYLGLNTEIDLEDSKCYKVLKNKFKEILR